MEKPSFQKMMDDMRSGEACGVFIDDSGSPGLKNTPDGLHPDRKTWCAVILLPEHAAEVMDQMPRILDELKRLTGASEYHFVDIFGGRREFKGVDPQLRFALIGAMAEIFSTRQFPVIVQTLDPDSLKKCREQGPFPDRLGPFDLTKHEDFGLFLLLTQVKKHLLQFPSAEQVPAHIFVDEGFAKAGQAISLPTFAPAIKDGLVCFADSSSVFPIQLADFAAFCLNRSQLIAGKTERSEHDIMFLRLVQPIAWNYLNIEQRTIDPDSSGNKLL